MAIVRGKLSPDPVPQPIRAWLQEVGVEVFRPWRRRANVEIGMSGTQPS